jgi:hypothetical protein
MLVVPLFVYVLGIPVNQRGCFAAAPDLGDLGDGKSQ